jgi:hypothetical protein
MASTTIGTSLIVFVGQPGIVDNLKGDAEVFF